jgi:hypothetical protein
MKCSFTLVIKPYNEDRITNGGLAEIRTIYSNNICLVAKNNKFDGIYIHPKGKLIKGKFHKVAGSIRYPLLFPKSEVHILFEDFPHIPKISFCEYVKPDTVQIKNLEIKE